MDELSSFLPTIIEDPGNIAPRLVFADFLQESGESVVPELIRLPRPVLPPGVTPRNKVYQKWSKWMRKLIGEEPLKSNSIAFDDLIPGSNDETSGIDDPEYRIFFSSFIFSTSDQIWLVIKYGFVEGIACYANWWSKWGPVVVKRTPLKMLYILDVNTFEVPYYDESKPVRSNLSFRYSIDRDGILGNPLVAEAAPFLKPDMIIDGHTCFKSRPRAKMMFGGAIIDWAKSKSV